MIMKIDLMALADCFTANEVLNCLFQHMPGLEPPIPVESIATEVGIREIKMVRVNNFEGALICTPEKQTGIIAIRNDSIPQRQRFSIGHELGHFLIPTHKPVEQGFLCKEIASYNEGKDNIQEKEADYFSANLLMPSHLVTPDMRRIGEPELGQLVALSRKYDVSVESFIRRYMSFCEYNCCAVFSRDNIVRYPVWCDGFPFLDTRKGLSIPRDSYAARCNYEDGYISDVEEIDPRCWLSEGSQRLPTSLYEQSICQSNGYKVTILWFDEDLEDEDNDDVEWAPPNFKK